MDRRDHQKMSVTEAKVQLMRSLEPPDSPAGRASSNGVGSLIDPQFLKKHAIGLSVGALAAGFVVGYSPPARRFAMKHAWTLLDELLK